MTAHANWRDDAACRDADPDLFFPVGTTGPVLRQIDEAKRICRACPAQGQCLAWALDQPITDGVWGGTTEDERRSIRSLWRSTTTSQEGDDDNGYQRAEHREHGTRARPAQTQATGIFGDVGIGRGHGETGATREAPGHPRQAVGLPKEKGSWHTGTPNVTSLSYASSKPKPGSCSRAWTSRIQSSQPRVAAACLGRC
jgi:WhiB family transcriptional regulator, redox-sensing transcriptional regulator